MPVRWYEKANGKGNFLSLVANITQFRFVATSAHSHWLREYAFPRCRYLIPCKSFHTLFLKCRAQRLILQWPYLPKRNSPRTSQICTGSGWSPMPMIRPFTCVNVKSIYCLTQSYGVKNREDFRDGSPWHLWRQDFIRIIHNAITLGWNTPLGRSFDAIRG